MSISGLHTARKLITRRADLGFPSVLDNRYTTQCTGLLYSGECINSEAKLLEVAVLRQWQSLNFAWELNAIFTPH